MIRAERSARSLDDRGRTTTAAACRRVSAWRTSDRLGLQIVRTLVSAELDGSLEMHDVPGGGTDVVLRVPIGGGRARACRNSKL